MEIAEAPAAGIRVAPGSIEPDPPDLNRKILMKSVRLILTLLLACPVAACTAEVEDPGELPNVEVEGGRVPEVDIDPARVEVSTDTQRVEVPDVDVSAPE